MFQHDEDDSQRIGETGSGDRGNPSLASVPDPVESPVNLDEFASEPDIADGELPGIPGQAVDESISEVAGDAADTEPSATQALVNSLPVEASAPDLTGSGKGLESTELEELTLPSTVQILDQLPTGTSVDPEGTIVVEESLLRRGQVNRYRATRTSSGEQSEVDLVEAPADHPGLSRMAEVLTQVQYSMLPRLHATWEADGKRYLATNPIAGPTLADALAEGMSTDEIISVTLQLAQALRRLQRDGWSLASLAPERVVTGQPVRITQLSTAIRIGDTLASPLHIPGYSAPELVQPAIITGNEAVFTLGAILYHGLSGTRVPEEGPELSGLSTTIRTPGVPQLLTSALTDADERIDLETFYERLLALRRRLTLAPIALRVASGTTIGLNPTRLVNEDACGYLAWCSAWEGRVVWNAVLCAIDGMGGMEAGEVASTSALRAVLRGAASFSNEQYRDVPGADLEADVGNDTATPPSAGPIRPSLDPRDLVRAAAEASFTAARGRTVGATITCAVIEDGILRLGHVGDTRAYLLRDGDLTQITRDHSLVAAMVASGVLSPEEARGHPESNKVLRSLGGMRSLPDEYVDTLSAAWGEDTLRLNAGDQLLLCTDGIWGTIDDNMLRDILLDAVDLEAAVQTAIDLALTAGAPDNAAVIIARCVVVPAS